MKKIAKKITDLIGNTPLLELERFQTMHNRTDATIVAKLEYFNPAGSVKDRIASTMIKSAEERGILKSGDNIIEPTSGNTGIGLALVAAANGYKLTLTMPETMSIERRRLLAALGAEIVLTPGSEGMQGAINRAFELQNSTPGSIILNQFENESNPKAHYQTTAEEIWRDTDGNIDILICCVGTGGTITGIGSRLKELNPDIEIIAVEPDASPVLSGGKAAPHKIQGIGAGFIPKVLNLSIVDRIVRVTNDDAMQCSREAATQEGLLVGISSGAALHAALTVAAEPQNRGKQIVAILADSGERYLSTELFAQS